MSAAMPAAPFSQSAPLSDEAEAAVAERLHEVRPSRQGLVEKFDRHPEFSDLVRHDPEQVQDIDVLRTKLEHLPVDALGLLQAPRPVLFQSNLHRLRYRGLLLLRAHEPPLALANVSLNFIFQNFPVDVRGIEARNS